MDEAGFVGEDDGLDPVAGLEFHEDASDMGLHGRFGQTELIADLGVAQPGGDEGENLALPRRQ